MEELPKAYDPSQVEARLYRAWVERGYFRALPDPQRAPWAVMMPLPNVTGELHIGHALNNTLQDVQTRFWRMRGRNALYQPGTDHAGIATQNVVERELAREGLRREDLGREGFEQRVWRWVEKYGQIIYTQLERLGISCDWDRKIFTLDPDYYDAVLEAFVRLYQRGRIYRSRDYMVNWCPRCATAISDLEVVHEEVSSFLWYVRYPGADGSEGIVIATQRPETILADVAVAVHPEDPRYRHLVGRRVVVPLVDRVVPVVADPRVDPEFGTGAVKITPGHDPLDYEIGKDHGLPALVVIGEDGRMNQEAGRFAGLDRFEAREQVARALEEAGLVVRREPYRTRVGRCDRCHTVIEPALSEQWFCDVREMAQRAADAIRSGRVRFFPERWARVAVDWLDNIRPWCISRQLWWGHRIPVWWCEACNHPVASKSAPQDRCPACGGRAWRQDPDVLDTWFSSALWPFATLGWPRDTEDLRYFYPTSVLITDRGIIFLWVCRMIMFGLEFMGEVPFHHVYINPTVMDLQGRRMSKSLGTGVDPLQAIQRYGADALRFGLVSRCSQAQQDLRFDEKMVADTRNFANKIWNATRYVLRSLDDWDPRGADPAALRGRTPDRWITSRLQRTVQAVTAAYEEYEFDRAARTLYHFLWSEFCDWYLEISKVLLQDPRAQDATRHTLWRTLEASLRLLHPIMPFVTEAAWQALPHEGASIMVAPWPQPDLTRLDPDAEAEMELVQQVVREVRSLRADLRTPPQERVEVRLVAGSAQGSLESHHALLEFLGRARVQFVDETQRPVPAAGGVVGPVEVWVPLDRAQADRLAQRAREELEEVQREIERVRSRLGNPDFLRRAPAEVVEAERERLSQAQARRDKLARYLVSDSTQRS
ncbi:MAG: valine--tRNA ligase [Armatimonadota bacterium]|nr:valine--tRNA ligase [Armatimonadota bacterium]MDR7603616.1 valine--tRNA ligase [Armatimonadota bacterium]